MALITRMSRLFKADFHAVLDQIEEPEMLLKQSIREMEESLTEGERHLKSMLVETEAFSSRQHELKQALGEIGDQLDVCFESGQEELARNLIRRQLEAQRSLKLAESKMETLKKNANQQQKSLEENRAILESMRQKAELFAERSLSHRIDQSAACDIFRGGTEFNITDHDVEVALLREKKRRSVS